jgi:ATP synthase F1 delta subunit
MNLTKVQKLAISIIKMTASESERRNWLKRFQAILDVSQENSVKGEDLLKATQTISELTDQQRAFLSVIQEQIGLEDLQLVQDCLKDIVFGDITLANIETAIELTEKQYKSITDALQKKYSTNSVLLDVLVDESLIAGLIVRVGDFVLESSIKQNIQNLTQNLDVSNEEVKLISEKL